MMEISRVVPQQSLTLVLTVFTGTRVCNCKPELTELNLTECWAEFN